MNVQMQDILNKKNANIQDVFEVLKAFVNDFESFKANISMVTELKNEIDSLKLENQKLKDKIKNVERRNRDHNLVFFNVTEPVIENIPERIKQVVNTFLGIEIKLNDIVDYYRVSGTEERAPLVVKFASSALKQNILRNCYKLKGNTEKIAVDNDLIPEDLLEKKTLLKCRRELAQRGVVAKIGGLHLIVNRAKYTANDIVGIPSFVEFIVSQTAIPSSPLNRQPETAPDPKTAPRIVTRSRQMTK